MGLPSRQDIVPAADSVSTRHEVPAMPINCKMNLEYAGMFSPAGLEKLTGVSQAQLGHYLHGRRKPSRRTIDKIQQGVNHFAKELTSIKFA